MQELPYFQSVAESMIVADRERDRMLRAMDDMWHNRWGLPPNVAGLKWIHKVVSSDPHDAVRAGTRVLSSVAPRIAVQPLGAGEAERDQAESLERALAWHFKAASRRRRASVLRDVVLSALLYDEVVAQVVYLPEQLRALKQFKAESGEIKDESDRQRALQRFGPFAIIVRNPQQVHVRYSDWMPEAVVLKQVMSLQEAEEFWGSVLTKNMSARDGAKRSARFWAREEKQPTHVTVYDYMDVQQRAVWAIPQVGGEALAEPTGGEEGAAVEILREEHGLGFLPWAAKVGGTTLHEGGLQRMPLLGSIWSAGQWDTQNIVETLLTSEMIAYAAAPRIKVEGPSDSIEVDYGEPGRPVYVPTGHHLDSMTPPGLDEGLAQIAQRVAERIGKSTVPRVLQTGDYPSGTAYATLNLATQSGIKALAPYKELAEEALAEIFTLMLNWVQHSGASLEFWESTRSSQNYGELRTLDLKETDLSNLAIEVELSADVPTDRMARINAASMAVRDLGYSRERALEQIGETDAKEVMRQAQQEQMDALELEIRMQQRRAEAGLPAANDESELPRRQGMNTAVGGMPRTVAG
jgi:hypothetical protein